MVTPRTLTIPVEGTTHQLEARLHRLGESGELALIAPPHPVYGGSIGNPVVRAMERAFHAAGISTLAFNFRGTGESTGEPSGEQADALVDFRAAALSVPDLPVTWCAGYSFGSVAALATACDRGIRRLLMVGPPLGMIEPALLTRYDGQLMVLLGDDDEYAPLAAARAWFEARADTTLTIVEGTEHYFLGSGVQRLAAKLDQVLKGAEA
jgi:alpha/beta superfamily hydrolase